MLICSYAIGLTLDTPIHFAFSPRLIYNRLQQFFKKHSVIHKSQYGFRKSISTEYAVLDIVSNAFENINQNLFNGLIFLDLRKPLTLSHTVFYFLSLIIMVFVVLPIN